MWWRDAVLYQIYVRSFADSNGDGIGDLPGLVSRLDHLKWLGVDAVWLSPVGPSPNADWGYDVAGYTDIDPDLGTMEDFDRLVGEAGKRGIRVVLDIVPNHTSDRHPWFVDSRSSRTSRHRDWYVWADPGPDGGYPNNWQSNFFGPAWSFDETTDQYYLHHFLPQQPDLNWWNPEVRDAFDEIYRFWYERGVAGFRIDVCHMIVKDRDLRDNPPATEDDHLSVRLLGQRQAHNSNQPELHDVLRRWRSVAEGFDPPRMLLGETYFFDLEKLVPFYGRDDELHLAFNFPFVFSDLEAKALGAIVAEMEETLPAFAWPVWTGSNHDACRFPSRWADGDDRKIRCALMMLLTLRGTPVLYYGDEIGMPNTDVPREAFRDPVGIKFYPAHPGRDPGRTPMHWSSEVRGGFTEPGVETWLPMGDPASSNVADQRDDPKSILHLCRDLLALRRERTDLRPGRYEPVRAPDGVWCYRRGESTLVVLNMQDSPTRLVDVRGRVLLSIDRSRDGVEFDGEVTLGAWEGLVIESG